MVKHMPVVVQVDQLFQSCLHRGEIELGVLTQLRGIAGDRVRIRAAPVPSQNAVPNGTG